MSRPRLPYHHCMWLLAPSAALVALGGCRTDSDAGAGKSAGTGPEAAFVAGPNSPISVGPHPVTVVIADFTGDGKPDLALTCGSKAEPDKGGIVLLLNQGAARFAPAPGGWIGVE